MPVSLIIDCDPGLDDAIAIALAAAARQLDIAAITSVAGNADIDMTTGNALAIVAALGLDIPVYRGAARPLDIAPHYGTALWGGDGSLGLAPSRKEIAGDAIRFLGAALDRAAPRSVTLCPIGPLTNIALVLRERPARAAAIAQMIIMGGAFEGGNVTPAAEFNIWFDPLAAAEIFAADIPAVLVPYDLTQHVVVDEVRIARLAAASTRTARMCGMLLPLAGSDSHPSSIHDACTIGWLLWPELFSGDTGIVSVDHHEGDDFGRTRLRPDPRGRHRLLMRVDRDPLLDAMVSLLAKAAS
ncbi:MAG: nucleoside hydrolase [Rhodospirillaceae bacterium]|nr:nucleoside hydrolase [Rhodospirillaceae bacterium]